MQISAKERSYTIYSFVATEVKGGCNYQHQYDNFLNIIKDIAFCKNTIRRSKTTSTSLDEHTLTTQTSSSHSTHEYTLTGMRSTKQIPFCFGHEILHKLKRQNLYHEN